MTTPPLPPGPGNPTGFARRINRFILEPWFAAINGRLARAGNDYRSIAAAIQAIPYDPNLDAMSVAQSMSYMKRVEEKHRHRFRRTMAGALGVPITPLTPALGVEGLMRRAIRSNADLIKTLPSRHKRLLTQRLLKLAATRPFDQAVLRDTVLQSRQSTYKRARLIARDQTSKLIGNLNQARQEQVGITEYVWRSSQDEAVRPTHRENDGQTFSWSRPPPRTGHPGQDINCRCVAIPVLPQRRDDTPRRRPLRSAPPVPSPQPAQYPASQTLGGAPPFGVADLATLAFRPGRNLRSATRTGAAPDTVRPVGSGLDWNGWEQRTDPRTGNAVFVAQAGADGPVYAIIRPGGRTPAQWDRLDLDPETDKWQVIRQGQEGGRPKRFQTLAAAREYVLRLLPMRRAETDDTDEWVSAG